MSPAVNAPTSRGEKFANVVFAYLSFVYALLFGTLTIMGLVCVWRRTPDGGALALLIAVSGLAFLFSLRLARTEWRKAQGVTRRTKRRQLAGRAVHRAQTAFEKTDDADAGAIA